MTASAEDKEARQFLIDNFFADYPAERAAELADQALRDLDEHEKPKYDVRRLNGHYSVEKIAEDEETKEKGSNRLRRENNSELERKVRIMAKLAAGLS
jgi:hypothetical protein